MDEDAELNRLRERIYGVDGASASAAEIARLRELEERQRGGGRAAPAAEQQAVGGRDAVDRPGDDAAAPVPDDGSPGPAPARRAVRWTLTALGAAALVGIGIAIGSSLAPTPAASADPAAAELPELTFPQTVEDVISADILRDSGIDPASTRYIATVSDFRIYLAVPDDGDGRCIATFTSADNRPWSAGCVSGAQEGAAVFGVDDSLTVAIGTASPSTVTGIPIRLSDSVTAYVAR
ncbi:hypothetical protein [Microbacterium testaceum]|uniref:Uncharacterized protein n=1 Tax=Microbacterium testaceum TaxID=2033 RepID=A0A2T7WWL3_MICTE|nr:hypothetical protein [Microbacterium testaceum]PVE78798.1 hypothetical protein DC432_03425 [Microbacterium testaceum]